MKRKVVAQKDKAIKNNGSERQSNIELLRIVSMLMIVSHHFSVHGGFEFTAQDITLNRFWLLFLAMWGKIGVNLFIFISGYFLSANNKLNLNKILKTWLQVFSYSVSILIVVYFIEGSKLSIKEGVAFLFPITFSLWWFASSYLFLLLFSPFINRLIFQLTKIEHRNIILVLGVFWSIWTTLTNTNMQSNSLLWFIYLYIIAAYIRTYQQDILQYGKKIVTASMLMLALTYMSGIVLVIAGLWIPLFVTRAYYLFRGQSILILIASVLIFLCFLRLNMKSIKWINIIATSSFGIYLIHDCIFIRMYLWQKLFRNASYFSSPYLIPYSIFAISAVFIGSCLCSLLMNKMLDSPIEKVNRWLLACTFIKNK
ncbi:TPA: acyltransferase [Streptococcus suis]|uniref:acyltransferase n=1 Tax=Streptococcus suis TaxID=1307 RepID=UPI0013752F2A|nr:acyltransferase [Streptococcus suis]MCK4068547.1 acyltransferase [Streptococcus suis]HEM6556621.1 acyltransferase [Streptococcus suis]HEM6589692.1 acyltransferase [Streptococcus suis]